MPESYSIQTSPGPEAFARIVFQKQSDRWTQRIEWVTPATTILIASSVEGSADCEWPPSQPLQEISQVELDGRPVLLGVGMAGRSHWSLSCSFEPGEGELAGAIFFDLACLVKATQPGWLGSIYQLGPNVNIGSCSDTAIRLRFGGNNEILLAARNPDQQAGSWGTRMQILDEQLQIQPAAMSTNPSIATRWAFAVEVAKNGSRGA